MKGNQTTKRRKAVAYIRTSSLEDDGTVQKHKIVEFCESENLQLVRTTSDIGQSGMDRGRHGLKDLLFFLEQNKGEIQVFIATDVDRISQHDAQVVGIQQHLKKLGVKIVCTDNDFLLQEGKGFKRNSGQKKTR